MSAEDLLRWAHEEYGDKLCLTCSWQKQSSVLVHMISELGLDVPIVELDTHLFFRETYETRDRLVERYGLKLLPPPPVITVAEQHKQEGPNLWERDPDRCCHIRKVEPLLAALKPYDAWISGIRRDQSPSRASTPKLQWSERYGVWKIHPLADWDERKVWLYIHVNEITFNPLHDAGYRSIGCMPCTRPVAPGEEERAGRWDGSDKLGCGIHLDTPIIDAKKETNGATRRTELGQPPGSPKPPPPVRFADESSKPVRALRSGSRAFRAPGRRRSRRSSAPSWSAAATSSSTSTATSSVRTSRRVSASRRRTGTRTSSGSAGSRRGSPATARRCWCRRSRRMRRPAGMRARWSRSTAGSSRCSSPHPSRSARAGTSRACTRRRSAARSRSSPAS